MKERKKMENKESSSSRDITDRLNSKGIRLKFHDGDHKNNHRALACIEYLEHNNQENDF